MKSNGRLPCLLIAIYIFSFGLIGANAGETEGLVVKTKLGKIQGAINYVTDENAQPVHTFLSIPYAKPPVEDMRFLPPRPPNKWLGTKDGTKYGPACPQNLALNAKELSHLPNKLPKTKRISEDCLNVNVFTPDIKGKRPVMVYFHGGGFVVGTASDYDATSLSAMEDIVVVTVGYRLGALGYLSTGDHYLQGNNGLKDQQLALKWVQESIELFGGDPNMVTIAGHSAGAIAVSLHMLSPASRGLFHRAISLSGSSLKPNQVRTYKAAKSQALLLGVMMGCTTNSNQEIAKCFKLKKPDDFWVQERQMQEDLSRWGFIIEDGILEDFPFNLMKENKINPVDYLVGVTNYEGVTLTTQLLPSILHKDPNFERAHDMEMKMFLTGQFPDNGADFSNKTVEFYGPPDEEGKRFTPRHYFNMLADTLLVYPTYKAAQYHSKIKEAKTFFYELTYRPSYSKLPEWVEGCDHGQELLLFFGSPFLKNRQYKVKFSDADKSISRMMMNYMGSFVRTGNPNKEGLKEWPVFEEAKENYLELKEVPEVKSDLSSRENIKFWEDQGYGKYEMLESEEKVKARKEKEEREKKKQEKAKKESEKKNKKTKGKKVKKPKTDEL